MAVANTVIWRMRPSGDNANGGGFDPAVSSPGTDRSQQNAAQVTFNGTTVTATTSGVSATLAYASAVAADAGNTLNITGGTLFTTGRYTIVSATSGTWTLDRNCCTGAASALVGRMGGGWGNGFDANLTLTAAYLAAGQTFYILGGAAPSYGSPDYTMGGLIQLPNEVAGPLGAAAGPNGLYFFLADPATPAGNGFGGRPVIKHPGVFIFGDAFGVHAESLWFVPSSATPNHAVFDSQLTSIYTIINCVLDQDGYDVSLVGGSSGGEGLKLFYNEVFSGRAARTTNAYPGVSATHFGGKIIGNNIHNCIGPGLNIGTYNGSYGVLDNGLSHIAFNIIAKNGGDGITVTTGGNTPRVIFNNTIDGNLGHGINFLDNLSLGRTNIFNNFITNHTGVGKAGINVGAGSATVNARLPSFIDYNYYTGNTANFTNLSANTHDITGSGDPYTVASTQNYTPTNTALYGFPGAAYNQSLAGKTTGVRSYVVMGASQPIAAKGVAFPQTSFLQHSVGQTTTVPLRLSAGAVQTNGVTAATSTQGPIPGTF